jgi:hypothetical protein
MFQYAAGLNLAHKNSTDLILDTVHIQDRFPRPHFTFRTFDLADVFALEPHFTFLSKIAKVAPLPGVWLGADLLAMNIAELFGDAHIIYEDEGKSFDPVILDAKGSAIIFGRWENEKYFIESATEMREVFRFRHALDGETAMIAEKISTGNSVSLHIRRGDYARVKAVTQLMGETNVSYYENAVAYITKEIPSPEFFIFSDDIEWCKENVKIGYPVTYVPASAAGPKAAFHLQLMSLCKHNIIANSTFSWWGAWLNKNPEKIVVAPKQWSSAASISGREVVPASWKAL